jgi:stage V sporulation protein R
MANASLFTGSSILMGNNTIPGVSIPDNILKKIPKIDRTCRDFGLDYHPFVVEFLRYDEISEIAAKGGFPNRYPHWRWGMEFEQLAKGYEYGMHRIYEMVVNSSPLYIYCLDSNTEVDHVTVIAHALGHGDFFKNNIFFNQTNDNMMNELASHATRIERYMSRWGRQEVSEFIDKVLSIDDMIDPEKAWKKDKYVEPTIVDKREYEFPHRFFSDHDYMNPWLNEKGWINRQKEKIKEKEIKKRLGIFDHKIKDVFGYIKDHAHLTIWQKDIMSMLHEESMYFSPQRYTKTINEGFASWVDHNIMACQGMAEDAGIIDYCRHKAQVLGGKYSMNPYSLGFKLLTEIEDRWNKGKFGSDYHDCRDMREKKDWDKNLGMGKQKVFEVRKYYNDSTLIAEFFDQEFVDKYEFFEWELFPNGERKIVSKDAKKIKYNMLQNYKNGHLPDIRLVDPNYRNKKVFLLEHQWDGRTLHPGETVETLTAIYHLWKNPIACATKDEDDEEIVYFCPSASRRSVELLSRKQFESKDF